MLPDSLVGPTLLGRAQYGTSFSKSPTSTVLDMAQSVRNFLPTGSLFHAHDVLCRHPTHTQDGSQRVSIVCICYEANGNIKFKSRVIQIQDGMTKTAGVREEQLDFFVSPHPNNSTTTDQCLMEQQRQQRDSLISQLTAHIYSLSTCALLRSRLTTLAVLAANFANTLRSLGRMLATVHGRQFTAGSEGRASSTPSYTCTR